MIHLARWMVIGAEAAGLAMVAATADAQVVMPPNAQLSVLGNTWVCKPGFYQAGERCLPVQVPQNAQPSVLGDRWICKPGFYQAGERCLPVQVPQNAQLSVLGDSWVCKWGFQQHGDRCLEIVPSGRQSRSIGEDRPGAKNVPPPPNAASVKPTPRTLQPAPQESTSRAPLAARETEDASRPRTSEASEPERVKFVQGRLQSLGYYVGPDNGNLDSATEAAIMKFQKVAGLTPDGLVSIQLHEQLQSEYEMCVVAPMLAADPAPLTRRCKERLSVR
jgi:hypothetical protein